MIKLSKLQLQVYGAILEGKSRTQIAKECSILASSMSGALSSLVAKGLITRNDDGQTFMVIDRTKAIYEGNMNVTGAPAKLREGTISSDLHRELEKKYKTMPRSLLAKQFKIPRFTLNQWAIENGFNSKEEETA